jgi:integrase
MLSDGNNLHLLVNPNGSKLWRFRYRFGGKQLMLSLGAFPEVTLAKARTRRDDAKKLLADGINPSEQRKTDDAKAKVAKATTFGLIAKEVIAKLDEEGSALATLAKQKWYLEKLAAPLTDKAITEVTAAEILDILKKIEKSGRKESAHKLRGAIGRVFRHAIVTLRATNDPTFALKGALLKRRSGHRAALTDETELGVLMTCIDEYTGYYTVKAGLKFLALTMTRPGEVRFMRRSEVNFIERRWEIPAERMKMRKPHDVPLSDQALEVLREVWDDGRELVFPSVRTDKRPLSENAFNVALRRMGYSKDEHCSHGFRTSASTILNGTQRYNPDVIEMALAHEEKNEVRGAYNRAKYWKERVVLLQDWANMLDEFKTRKQQVLA